jgi:TRAP-type mannitol/chloroaromatic compound transport system permease small subunit
MHTRISRFSGIYRRAERRDEMAWSFFLLPFLFLMDYNKNVNFMEKWATGPAAQLCCGLFVYFPVKRAKRLL